MKPRVGINALFLHHPRTGTGRYLEQLVDLLPSSVDVGLFGSRAFPPATREARVPVSILRTPFDSQSRPLAKIWFEQVSAPTAMSQARLDLAHCPHFAAPLRPVIPTVVTVHDLATVLLPEYRRSPMQRLYALLVTRGLRSARRIITDSRASARDLVDRLGVTAASIDVIPLGVDARFRPPADDESETWVADVEASCGVTRPYLLYVGSFELRKNLGRLVEAFAGLKNGRRLPHQLVLVGDLRTDHQSFYDPRPDLERLGVENSVRLVGSRSDDDVVKLLAGADAFVFPSTYEGFGLPPLEAMACGTPVACSNASSLPEVVGDAGVLFDPLSVRSITDVVDNLVRDRALRELLINRGLRRARDFTWQATADATVDTYFEALVNGR